MRKAKLWSVLLAAVLLCACIVGVLFVGAQAEENTINYVVDSTYTTDVSANQFKTFKEAIAQAATLKGENALPANSHLVITLNNDEVFDSANASGYNYGGGNTRNFFGLNTLWMGSGDSLAKLPITIQGKDETIKLTWNAAGWQAQTCANDYTFKDLDLDWSTRGIKASFYAGSSQIRFDNCDLGEGGNLYLHSDNYAIEGYADAAYTGWTEEQINAVLTADSTSKKTITTGITFGEGTTYLEGGDNDTVSPQNNSDAKVQLMGAFNRSWTYTAGNATITNKNTKIYFVMESGSRCKARIYGSAYANTAANSVDEVTIDLRAGAQVHTAAAVRVAASAEVNGNFTVKSACGYGWKGNNIIYGVNQGILKGTLNIEACQGAETKAVRGVVANATFDGAMNVTISDTARKDYEVYPFYGTGVYKGTSTVTLNVPSGVTVSIYGVTQDGAPAEGATLNVENNVYGTVTTFYGGSSTTGAINGTITNTIDGGTITTFYGGSAGGTVTGNITNDFKSGTITNFYGGSADGTVTGTITNTFGKRNAAGSDAKANVTTEFYGGMKTGTVNKVVNTFNEGFNFLTTKANSVGNDAYAGGAGTVTNYIENTFNGGTFTGTGSNQDFSCGGKVSFGTPTETITYRVKNVFRGGTFAGWRLIGGCGRSGAGLASDAYGLYNVYENDPTDNSYMVVSSTHYNSLNGTINKIKVEVKGRYDSVLTGGGNSATVNDLVVYVQDGANLKYIQGSNSGGHIENATFHLNGGTIADFRGAGTGTADNLTVNFGKFGADGKYDKTLGAGTTVTGSFAATHNNSSSASSVEKVVFNVYDATFTNTVYFGPIGGSATKMGVVTTIENNIYGGTFEKEVYCGAKNSYTSVTSITNTISGGNFGAALYCGSTDGTVGTITNTITDGTFVSTFCGGSKAGMVNGTITNEVTGASFGNNFYGGNNAGTVNGKITNTFSGTIDKIRYIYGGSNGGTCKAIENTFSCEILAVAEDEYGIFGGGNSASSASVYNKVESGFDFVGGFSGGSNNCTTLLPTVTTDFNGGTLEGVYRGGGRVTPVGTVVSNFNGGTICGACYGGTQSGNVESITNNFNGTTFEKAVYGGNQGAASTQSITSTVKAGTFADLYAGSVGDADESVSLVVIPTGDVTITGTMRGCTQLTGTVNVGEDSFLVIAHNPLNDITVNQTETWKNQRYVVVEGSKEDVIINATGANADEAVADYYFASLDQTVLQNKETKNFLGASMILTDRIQVKIFFDGSVPETFSFETESGVVLGSNAKNAEIGENYVVLNALGPALFDEKIYFVADGYGRTELSIIEIAQSGLKNDEVSDEVRLLYKTIANLRAQANGLALPYGDVVDAEASPFEPAKEKVNNPVGFTVSKQTVLMSNATGYRLIGTVNATEEDGTFKALTDLVGIYIEVGGEEISANDFVTVTQSAGKAAFTIDLYLKADALTTEFRVILKDKTEGTEVFGMNTRVDAVANKIIEAETTSEADKALAQQLLNYIYAAEAYKN